MFETSRIRLSEYSRYRDSTVIWIMWTNLYSFIVTFVLVFVEISDVQHITYSVFSVLAYYIYHRYTSVNLLYLLLYVGFRRRYFSHLYYFLHPTLCFEFKIFIVFTIKFFYINDTAEYKCIDNVCNITCFLCIDNLNNNTCC